MQPIAYLFLALALMFIVYSSWGMAAISLVLALLLWGSARSAIKENKK